MTYVVVTMISTDVMSYVTHQRQVEVRSTKKAAVEPVWYGGRKMERARRGIIGNALLRRVRAQGRDSRVSERVCVCVFDGLA
jgi:hypothetical protein